MITWRRLTDLLPLVVVAFELVAEAHLLRGDEAQRRVINREVANSAAAGATLARRRRSCRRR